MEIRKTYNIHSREDAVRQVLTDLHQYGRLHPLIKQVEKIDQLTSENPTFKITERPYNWAPIIIQYSATLNLIGDEFEYEITGIPLTKAWIRYSLREIGINETEVNFHLKILGKLPAKKILQGKMVAAQNQLMEAMQKEFST